MYLSVEFSIMYFPDIIYLDLQIQFNEIFVENNIVNIYVLITAWDTFIVSDMRRCDKHKTSYVRKEKLQPGMDT